MLNQARTKIFDEIEAFNLEVENVAERKKLRKQKILRRTCPGIKMKNLMDLPRNFGTRSYDSSVTASSGMPKSSLKPRYVKEKKLCPELKSRKNETSKSLIKCQGHSKLTIYLVEISCEVYENWQSIGSEKGFTTDTDIAAFLIKHFQETEERRCTTCQSTLRLLCHRCPPPSPSPPNTPVSTSPLFSSQSTLTSTSPRACSPGLSEEAVDDSNAFVLSEPVQQISKPFTRRCKRRGQNSQSHVCPDCGSQFARAGGLKVHMRIHTGEKPYVCSECGQKFSQSGQLTVHMRKHKGERPFVCIHCPASFPLAGSLKQHMRVHTGDRPYSCPHCPRHFSYAGDLTVHLRKHTGDRPFLCSDCGKRFAVSSDLSKHKKIHTNYKPFKCCVCFKGFPFLNRLTLHMRTHTGDKPFLCADCGSSFSRASNLTVHRRVHHTFEKPFVCPICQHAFADSANLSKHKKNKHGKHKTELKQSSPLDILERSGVHVAHVPLHNDVPVSGACESSSVVDDSLMSCENQQLQASTCGKEDGLAVVESQRASEPVFPLYNFYHHQTML